MAPPPDDDIRPHRVCTDFLRMRQARRENGRSRRRGRQPDRIGLARDEAELTGAITIAKAYNNFSSFDLDVLLAGADQDQLARLRQQWQAAP